MNFNGASITPFDSEVTGEDFFSTADLSSDGAGSPSSTAEINLNLWDMPPHSEILDFANAPEMASFNPFGQTTSVTPLSSSTNYRGPSPVELVDMLNDTGAELAGAFNGVNGVSPISVSPSDLHSPYMSPQHSRNVSVASTSSSMSAGPFSPYVNPRDIFGLPRRMSPCAPSPVSSHGGYLATPSPVDIPHTITSTSLSCPPGPISGSPSSAFSSPTMERLQLSGRECSPSTSRRHAHSPAASGSHVGWSGSSACSITGHHHHSSSYGASPLTFPVSPIIHTSPLLQPRVASREITPALSAGPSDASTPYSADEAYYRLSAQVPPASKKRKWSHAREESETFVSSDEDAEGDEYVTDNESACGSNDYDYDEGNVKKIKSATTTRRVTKKPKLSTTTRESYRPELFKNKSSELQELERHHTKCPICSFAPANGRYSDIQRHYQSHFASDAKDRPRWICNLCGNVETRCEQVRGKDGSITTKSFTIYVPVHSSRYYTRKDSASRHWRGNHRHNGEEMPENVVQRVDRIQESESDQDASGSSEL